MIRIRNVQDLAGGLFLILIAALALIFSDNLPVGKLVNMGSGYVPRTLAWILGGIGVIVGLRGITVVGPGIDGWAWRPILALTASIVLFAFTLERAGLVICIILTVAVAGLAERGIKWTQSAAVGVVLAVLSVALFVYGLGLPLLVWPEFGR